MPPKPPKRTFSKDKPLRIALLTYRGKPHCGGQGVYTRHLAKELKALGHHIEVFSGQPYPELDEGIVLHKLPSLDIYNSAYPGRMPGFWEIKSWADMAELGSYFTGNFGEPLSFSLRALKALSQRAGDFDIVHDNQSLGYGILGLKRWGFPVLATIHHPITVDKHLEIRHSKNLIQQFSKSRWYAFTKMQTRVAQQLKRIITITEATRKDIHTAHRVPLERIGIVSVGVDPELFRPQPEIKRNPAHLLTTASADVPLKGLVYLLEAVAKLRTERDIHLTVIGKPAKAGPAERAIKDLGLKEAVTFLFNITDDEVVKTYARSSAAVVPSLYEGFSLPAIETMATETPLIATSGGGLPEVVGRDGQSALLVEPGDSEALAAAIRKLLDNPELAKKLGINGRKRVIERWSWKHTAAKTAEEYKSLLC